MSKELITDLRWFAETTSVRGIPRVMKAKTRVTFVVWLVAVLTCAALLVWQLSVVLMRYFQYPVTTLTVEAPAWQTPTFPDFTVCNLNPNVYDTNMYDTDPNDEIAAMNKSFSYTISDSPIIMAFHCDALGFIVDSAQITAAWDPQYYKCFTLKPQNSDLRGNISSLNAILYVSNAGPNAESSLYVGLDSIAIGLSVVVHAPGTAADMTYGVNIGPGTTTIIQITQSVRTRLGEPYSNCTNNPYLPWDNTSAAYTQRYCVQTCIQQQIADQCGCVSVHLSQYTMAQLRKVNYQVCEISHEGTADGDVAKYSSPAIESCVTQILDSKAYTSAATCSCVLPCSELQYDTATSVVPATQSAAARAYANEILSQPRFLHLFMNVSADTTDEEVYAATTTPEAVEFLAAGFMHLIVQFGSQSFIELNDVAAFSMDAMGAQIGGVLSLWLGVTVMFVFEAFEFIYIYLTNSCRKETTQARRISVAPAPETESSADAMQTGPTSTAASDATRRSQMVVVQIE